MSGRRTQASASKKARLTRAQAATAAAVMGLGASTTSNPADPSVSCANEQDAWAGTPELGSLPPRHSKVKALDKKVWTTLMPAPKRKRAVAEPDAGTPTASQVNDNGPNPPKKAKTKGEKGAGTSQAIPMAHCAVAPCKAPSSKVKSQVIKPLRSSRRTPATSNPGAHLPGGSVTTGGRTVLRDDAADEASSGEDELSDGENTPPSRDDDDDDAQSESGDDPVLDDGGDDLEAYLAAEKPIWQDRASSAQCKGGAMATDTPPELTTPATRTRYTGNRTTQGRVKYTLPADFDNSSGSEFEPLEDDDDVDEDELKDEIEGAMVEVGRKLAGVRSTAASSSTSSKPSKKVKAPTKAQLARQRLEIPTWKQGSSGTSVSVTASTQHATTQAGKPVTVPGPGAFPVMPAPTSISIISDVPSFATHDDDPEGVLATTSIDDDDDDDDAGAGAILVDLVTNPPAQSFVLVFPPGGGPLNISPQQQPVQATLHGANATVIKNVVFQNAFPDSFGRSKFVADALVTAATVHGYTGLVDRLKYDQPFLRSVSGVAKQRISNFRGTIKKAAEGFVFGFYGVGTLPTAECADKVSFMLENLTYIYPFVYEPGKRSVPWGKPYAHPCVLALLTVSFFQGPKSIAAKYPDLFPSSYLDRPQEHEIPSSMLALVGVAIHAALAEWRSGLHRSIPFTADAFVDVYNEHMAMIKGIKSKKLAAYHTMMNRLYKSASNITPITDPATAPVGTALDLVDVDAMDID